MECFIHNMPANEMTLIMEQEESWKTILMTYTNFR